MLEHKGEARWARGLTCAWLAKLTTGLEQYASPEISRQVLAGSETLDSQSRPEAVIAWTQEAMACLESCARQAMRCQMTLIRELEPSEIDSYVEIAANAYPGLNVVSQEQRWQYKQRLIQMLNASQNWRLYGLFRQGRLLGGTILIDLRMRLLSANASAGGIADVAVDLVHKRKHVARELMAFSLEHFRQRGASIAMLYPFRPDYYKRMGFGFGTPMHEYRVKPACLPQGPSREHIQFIDHTYKPALAACYHRVQQRTHGLLEKTDYEFDSLLTNPAHRIIGYCQGDRILGYMVFRFQTHPEANWLKNDIQVRELIYENSDVLLEMLTFLHTQADQIDRIVIPTQDEYLHHLVSDPRDGSERIIPTVYHQTHTAGIGIMYRIIDTPAVFAALRDHDFGGQTCLLRLTVRDTFLPENAGSLIVHFDQGKARICEAQQWDVEISLDIADWSTLLMGVIDFRSLYRLGLAHISDPSYVDTIRRLFAAEKPICMSAF